MAFKPFSDELLMSLYERFGDLHVYTPPPRARPAFLPPLPKDAPPPAPPFSLAFRPCTPAEWRNVATQANDAKTAASSPFNLCMSTVVAVSIDGEIVVWGGEAGTAPNDRAASKAPREAFERLVARPGNAALPDALTEALMAFNGKVDASEGKG